MEMEELHHFIKASGKSPTGEVRTSHKLQSAFAIKITLLVRRSALMRDIPPFYLASSALTY